jgi:hypothetical protein
MDAHDKVASPKSDIMAETKAQRSEFWNASEQDCTKKVMKSTTLAELKQQGVFNKALGEFDSPGVKKIMILLVAASLFFLDYLSFSLAVDGGLPKMYAVGGIFAVFHLLVYCVLGGMYSLVAEEKVGTGALPFIVLFCSVQQFCFFGEENQDYMQQHVQGFEIACRMIVIATPLLIATDDSGGFDPFGDLTDSTDLFLVLFTEDEVSILPDEMKNVIFAFAIIGLIVGVLEMMDVDDKTPDGNKCCVFMSLLFIEIPYLLIRLILCFKYKMKMGPMAIKNVVSIITETSVLTSAMAEGCRSTGSENAEKQRLDEQKGGLLASIRHILQQFYVIQGWSLEPADLEVLVDQLGSQLNSAIGKLELEEKGCEELFGAAPTETTETRDRENEEAVSNPVAAAKAVVVM